MRTSPLREANRAAFAFPRHSWPERQCFRSAPGFLPNPAKSIAKTCDAIRHSTWAIHDFRCVEDGVGAIEDGQRLIIGVPCRRQILETIPGRIMSSRQGFADARRSMTQADIAIFPAGIAELGEAPVLAGDEERTSAIHCDIA